MVYINAVKTAFDFKFSNIMNTLKHGNKRSCRFYSFYLFTFKLVIWQSLSEIKTLIEKSSLLYWYKGRLVYLKCRGRSTENLTVLDLLHGGPDNLTLLSKLVFIQLFLLKNRQNGFFRINFFTYKIMTTFIVVIIYYLVCLIVCLFVFINGNIKNPRTI